MTASELNNPVYNALLTGDATRSFGTDRVKFFDEEVSPFAGFHEDYQRGFDDLLELLPPARGILHATPRKMAPPKGWRIAVEIEGLQFVFDEKRLPGETDISPVPLGYSHVEQMMELAALTKPGPFNRRTIDFGHYFGFFEQGTLVAMTGQRLHLSEYSEVSAVCTHPDFLGRGLAAALIIHQLHLIKSQGKQAFLHVRADNSRAIALYERLGFFVSRPMFFYFMKRTGTGDG